MPSLSLLKRLPRDPPESPRNCQSPESVGGDDDNKSPGSAGSGPPPPSAAGRGRERRNSKRDFLFDLIGRSRLIGRSPSSPPPPAGSAASSSSTPLRGRSGSAHLAAAATSPIHGSEASSLSPRSPINPNKPLPSPPPPGSEQARGPPLKPVLKLDRIMASLTDSEIEKLFSGAPQYFARSEGHFTGAPHPSVAFPWDEELQIRDLTDHGPIEVKAWGCVTAWPHITRDIQAAPALRRKSSAATAKHRAHFYPRCRERPNMLSMVGLEKGSVGYQAALELGVADALQEEQFGFETLGTRDAAVVEQRHKMLAAKDGLRRLDETAILELLVKNGERYSQPHPRERRETAELYNELFLHILHPPIRVLDHNDPYSLSVQIQSLVRVLAAPSMWVDFSHVEWRIRLGQLLWAGEDEAEADGASIRSGSSAKEAHEERYWLLLQILLACELLIRLDAITEGDELGMEYIKPSEIHRFEKDANRSVKWSMHLARAWLENIEVVRSERKEPEEEPEKPSGWLATLTKRMSLSQEHGGHHQQAPVYVVKGKHCDRQVDGLTHFATRLRWPGIESYASRISDNCRAVTEGTPLTSPLPTPASRASRQSSYFGGSKGESSAKTTPSRRQKISAALHPSGWLSKSYVSGLMLPGEGICHFLMSTLLENDPEAMASLGPMANLCGGFVYSGKSFWSTACIVGRVLAAGKGSAECMGWISSDITPEGLGDGWVNIEAESLPDDVQLINKKARLWTKTCIERESNVLGDTDPSSVLPADFIIPFENIYREKPPQIITIELNSLKLWAPVDSVNTTPAEEKGLTPFSEMSSLPEIFTYPAAVSFTVTEAGSGQAKEYTYSLSNDVNFVTAHPCAPSQHVKILKSPSSPTVQQVDLSGNGGTGKTASVVGHPLHKYYTYTAIHLSDLLAKQDLSLEALLSNYSSTVHCPSLTPAAPGNAAKVLVVDCITGFGPLPQEHEIPLSPVLYRSRSRSSAISDLEGLASPSPPPPPPSSSKDAATRYPESSLAAAMETAQHKMHQETKRRQFGSDMEILVRAFCAERGWNALISRRRRGCLACAIREAGALGWKVVIRVD